MFPSAIQACTCAYTKPSLHTLTYTHDYIHTYSSVLSLSFTHTHIHTHLYTSLPIHSHTLTHTYNYSPINLYECTHTGPPIIYSQAICIYYFHHIIAHHIYIIPYPNSQTHTCIYTILVMHSNTHIYL